MDIDKCFLFDPTDQPSQTSKKKRRAAPSKVSREEDSHLWRLRLQAFEDNWEIIRRQLESEIEAANSSTLNSVVKFVDVHAAELRNDQKFIPTALIIASSGILSHTFLFDQLAHCFSTSTQDVFFTFTPSEAPNLKTALRNIAAKITSPINNERFPRLHDGGRDVSRQNSKLLEYDLTAVQRWLVGREIGNVVMALQDSEGFDSNVLAEVVETLHIWLDRIPFTLIFGVATTSDMFEERLPAHVIKYLNGKRFDVCHAAELFDKVFWATIVTPDVCLKLGHSLASSLIGRQSDHIRSVEEFRDTLKYCFMSHFFSNPLSIFLSNKLDYRSVSEDYFIEAKCLKSFRRQIEELLADERAAEVRVLVESNSELYNFITSSIESGHMDLQRIVLAVDILSITRGQVLRSEIGPQRPLLYSQAMAGNLQGSALVRETLLNVKKLSSDSFKALLEALTEVEGFDDILNLANYLESLKLLTINEQSNSTRTLKSEHDSHTQSVRTTVVAQKVELSRHKSTLSKQDAAYSKLIDEFHSDLRSFFESSLIDPNSLVFNEIFINSNRFRCIDAFVPRPRNVIERALSKPHDYLNCQCCVQSDVVLSDNLMDTIMPSEPGTSILYRLYLESGALLNVNDLWSAFQTMVDGNEDVEEMQQRAQFQQSLSEMKNLGMVRASRKKTDHIAKIMWKGL